jgi:hypothetical protein
MIRAQIGDVMKVNVREPYLRTYVLTLQTQAAADYANKLLNDLDSGWLLQSTTPETGAAPETSDHQWLIRKRGYYYRPDRAGYTASIAEAGRYTEAEAKAEAAIEPAIMQAVPLAQALNATAEPPATVSNFLAWLQTEQGKESMRQSQERVAETARMLQAGHDIDWRRLHEPFTI